MTTTCTWHSLEWKTFNFQQKGLAWIGQLQMKRRLRSLGFILLGVLSLFTVLMYQRTNLQSIQSSFPKNLTSPASFTVEKSLIHDQTVAWDPTVDRMWLNPQRQRRDNTRSPPPPPPPAMILLTSYGWNKADQSDALQHYSRQTRESELLDGIVNHPWFHPTAWDDIENSNENYNVTIRSILGPAATIPTRFYVFLDMSVNCEVHYPKYYSFDANLDTSGGRINSSSNVIHQPWWTIDHPIWQSKFMTQLGANHFNQVKLVLFDCNEEQNTIFTELRRNHSLPIVLARISGTIAVSNETIDMGLPPPLLNKATKLNTSQIESIYTCAADYDETQRPYYITYIGNFRSGPNEARFPARAGFADLNDNQRMFGLQYFLDDTSLANVSYEDILKRSIYSGAPRGDAKYSYRFTEVLASGGIPIVMADDWMLPFRPELVKWDECIILIPEKDIGLKMLKYIAPITLSERCERRKKCYDIYRNYIETGRKVIDGMIQGLELVALGHRANMTAIHCDPTQPDSNDCNPVR